MTSNQDLFEASVLELIVPPPSLEFPADYSPDQAAEWISRMRGPSADRKTAFFDENLDFFLIIRLPEPFEEESTSTLASPRSPPLHVLSFLAHLQIAFETSYISSSPSPPDPTTVSHLSLPPPRNSSMQRNRLGPLLAANPSMLPPHTPHPIPSAAEADLQYVQSQGTPLVSAIWGDSDEIGKESFALLWDSTEQSWLAIYQMSILVLFMITKLSDPLLCITVSMTLRNKPLAPKHPRETLTALIDAAGGLPESSAVKANGIMDGGDSAGSEDEDVLSGLQEVNLLEGLASGPTFNDAQKRLSLPSTRLGTNTRMHAFSLGPAPAAFASSTPVPYTSSITSPPVSGNLPPAATLRKSFRKTLRTHMGFRVRMRTVFVPYFLLPQHSQNGNFQKLPLTSADSDSDTDEDILEEREEREAGNEEHTVVLSVEVENLFAGPSPAGNDPYHFAVVGVDVSISGTGARASFIGWGHDQDGFDTFPLHLAPREQVNLLYAVSFLRGPEVDDFSLARPSGSKNLTIATEELHRAVTINLTVRPFEPIDDKPFYPTHAFPSRWNCVLDLASSSISQQKDDSADIDAEEETHDYFVLPTPASPFPTAPLAPPSRNLTPLTTRSVVPLTAVAGNKRHTFSAFENNLARMPKSPMNYHSSTSLLNPHNQPQTPTSLVPSHRASYIPPSVAFQAGFPRSPSIPGFTGPTSPPLPPLPPHPLSVSTPTYTHVQTDSVSTINEALESATPRTPAYPAYPSSPAPVPPTPLWQSPLAQQSGAGGVTVGPSVDIRRERGGGVPQTPGPTVGGFGRFGRFGGSLQPISEDAAAVGDGVSGREGSGEGGEPIVVSVGLLPNASGKSGHMGPGELYPLDQFTLDIFVFNQSSWTRRFEVSYPEERGRRRKVKMQAKEDEKDGRSGSLRSPGVIALQNRVRVGPLLPSTCQSVRMDFLALAPGVHSIEALTLTDVQSNFTMHLRNVIDVIVHEPQTAPA